MKKSIGYIITGIFLALLTSVIIHPESIPNIRFNLGFHNQAADEKDIQETLRLFNKHFATFFNTGGKLAGLNEFPAANLIKRRIFQEINEWKKKNQILVYDKDSFEIEEITLLNPVNAIALTKEVWFLSIQEKDTRKKLSPVKANSIRVRYILNKINNKWGVFEYEVFGNEDDIPALKMERFYL
jgi:hypothetical protein